METILILILAALWFAALAFIWALCRVAANADRMAEEQRDGRDRD